MKVIAFDLKANFGFFKKPDINDTIFITYNMIHKPVLLGIFGAILGLSGHFQYSELPEYYKKLEFLKIGIEPIGKKKKNGNFEKTTVKYNNSTGHANANDYGGATLNILEQILIQPEFRIYLQLDEYQNFASLREVIENLKDKLTKGESTFIPYFGKNDFPCWWENVNILHTVSIEAKTFKISTIFTKPEGILLGDLKKQMAFGLIAGMKAEPERKYTQFERLPIGFNNELKQYSDPQEFVFTNIEFSKEKFGKAENFFQIEGGNNVIYLF